MKKGKSKLKKQLDAIKNSREESKSLLKNMNIILIKSSLIQFISTIDKSQEPSFTAKQLEDKIDLMCSLNISVSL